MIKVLTYGTYDLLHQGHINLLRRAKELGDYLIVGVTADGFDQARGKINTQQSLMERIEAVKATGYVDEIIIEEYEGQKIDDIKRYNVDIFTVGSDWEGKFDYLKEYCNVVYLERTKGISSSDIRSNKRNINIGLVGDLTFLSKFEREGKSVNGVNIIGVFPIDPTDDVPKNLSGLDVVTNDYDLLLSKVDAVYLYFNPKLHYEYIKKALLTGKHVLCESPITISITELEELQKLAKDKNLILMEAIRTAYSTAYHRLVVLAKSGVIGDIVSIDARCTSLRDREQDEKDYYKAWTSFSYWGPNAMLPIFQLLGTEYKQKTIISRLQENNAHYDAFSSVDFIYPKAVGNIKVGKGVKTEGHLIISGTTGYIYVPAPWWKTDYFEIRREDSTQDKRYFYQLDGEGIPYELVSFAKAIQTGKDFSYISMEVTRSIVNLVEDFYKDIGIIKI
ncbi:MAG: adenylyltransferase/cytidyltransferase family protein [Flavobacteriales bacterium]|nr:adenylyltransferase/cytidyltransferase family protein [Flavobacteriales bacterium]